MANDLLDHISVSYEFSKVGMGLDEEATKKAWDLFEKTCEYVSSSEDSFVSAVKIFSKLHETDCDFWDCIGSLIITDQRVRLGPVRNSPYKFSPEQYMEIYLGLFMYISLPTKDALWDPHRISRNTDLFHYAKENVTWLSQLIEDTNKEIEDNKKRILSRLKYMTKSASENPFFRRPEGVLDIVEYIVTDYVDWRVDHVMQKERKEENLHQTRLDKHGMEISSEILESLIRFYMLSKSA